MAAVFAIVVVHAGGTAATVALAWSALTAIATYLLAYRRGVTGYRLILVGIGVATCSTLRSVPLDAGRHLRLPAGRRVVDRKPQWPGMDDLRPIAVTLALVVPVVASSSPGTSVPSSSATTRRGGSASAPSVPAVLLVAGVALAAVATAPAGPIGFVALMAPQITRQLVGGRALGLLPAAAGGALLVVASDLVARQLFAPDRVAGRPDHRRPRRCRICSTSSPVPTATCPENEDVRLPSAARCRRRLARLRLRVSEPSRRSSVPSGKSTLPRGLARLLAPSTGAVLLDGQDITLPTRAVAARVGILPQQPSAPDGLTVADLVGRGRHPHQRWFRQWSPADAAAVEEALEPTAMTELADRLVDELSGGQRQRPGSPSPLPRARH